MNVIRLFGGHEVDLVILRGRSLRGLPKLLMHTRASLDLPAATFCDTTDPSGAPIRSGKSNDSGANVDS